MKITVEKQEQLPNGRVPMVFTFPETNERLTYLARRIGQAAREMADCFLYEGPLGSFEFAIHRSHGELYGILSSSNYSLPSSHPRQNISSPAWAEFLDAREVREYEVQRYPWNTAPKDPSFIAHFLEMIRQIAIQGLWYDSPQEYVVADIPRHSEYGYPNGPASYVLDPYGFHIGKN